MSPSPAAVSVLEAALATQQPSGAFPSWASTPAGTWPDENAFATALTALELLRWPDTPGTRAAAERALAWLAGCGRSDRRGVYGFYPWTGHPAWLGERLPADVDDTALVQLLRLALGGGLDEARWALHVVLEGQRLTRAPAAAAPWVLPGLYATWLDGGRVVNPVDLCANLNVAALRARLGAAEPHAAALAQAWALGLEALHRGHARPEQLAPYYPHPGEWVHALGRALRCGAAILAPLEAPLAALAAAAGPGPICTSAGARVRWHSPTLTALRALPLEPS